MGLVLVLQHSIDLFTDMVAILNSTVSNSNYGMLRRQIHTNFHPEYPIIQGSPENLK